MQGVLEARVAAAQVDDGAEIAADAGDDEAQAGGYAGDGMHVAGGGGDAAGEGVAQRERVGGGHGVRVDHVDVDVEADHEVRQCARFFFFFRDSEKEVEHGACATQMQQGATALAGWVQPHGQDGQAEGGEQGAMQVA